MISGFLTEKENKSPTRAQQYMPWLQQFLILLGLSIMVLLDSSRTIMFQNS